MRHSDNALERLLAEIMETGIDVCVALGDTAKRNQIDGASFVHKDWDRRRIM